MVDLIPVVEGDVKFRDGKKWKMRYAVVTRLSPVADSLTFQIWKNRKDKDVHATPSKGSLVLEDYIGNETGFTLDKESLTLAILLKDMVITLAFNSREVLMRWQIRLSSQFESGRSFSGSLLQSPPKLPSSGPVKIYVHNDRFFLSHGSPPFSLIHSWKISHLRRYGVLEDSRFVFEGGSLCEKGEGLHILRLSGNASELKTAFDLAANRKLPGGSIASLNTDSPGNSFSSSSSNSNGCYKLGRHHFSTSCDTMSEVLSSEFNPSIEGSGGGGLPTSGEENTRHLVNRRNLLEKIYSLCEKSSDKIKSSVNFDPSWSMKGAPSGEGSGIHSNNGYSHPPNGNCSFDSLISFNETESKYDNPRPTLNECPKKLLRDPGSRGPNSFIFENYDIPKAIPPSSLYDVPRSLNALQEQQQPSRSSPPPHHASTEVGGKVRINGQGKMPLADLRNGFSTLNTPPQSSASPMPEEGAIPNAVVHYINLDPSEVVERMGGPSVQTGCGGHQMPLYENMVPLDASSSSAANSASSTYPHHYDTINIKLRKFHDLLSNSEDSSGSTLPKTSDSNNNNYKYALDTSSKRKSTSLGSLLEPPTSSINNDSEIPQTENVPPPNEEQQQQPPMMNGSLKAAASATLSPLVKSSSLSFFAISKTV